MPKLMVTKLYSETVAVMSLRHEPTWRAVASIASNKLTRLSGTPSGRLENSRDGAAASSITNTPLSSALRIRRPKA